jgi:hypothetical protein
MLQSKRGVLGTAARGRQADQRLVRLHYFTNRNIFAMIFWVSMWEFFDAAGGTI